MGILSTHTFEHKNMAPVIATHGPITDDFDTESFWRSHDDSSSTSSQNSSYSESTSSSLYDLDFDSVLTKHHDADSASPWSLQPKDASIAKFVDGIWQRQRHRAEKRAQRKPKHSLTLRYDAQAFRPQNSSAPRTHRRDQKRTRKSQSTENGPRRSTLNRMTRERAEWAQYRMRGQMQRTTQQIHWAHERVMASHRAWI